MSVLVPFNGSNYLVPSSGETGWATNVTNLLSDLGNNAIPKGNAVISTGSVNAVPIGNLTPSTGAFTSLSSGSVALTGGSIDNTPIGSTTPSSGFFTNIANATDIGRNLLQNGMFRVQQRGTGPFTANGYTADRWLVSLVTDANSFAMNAIADAGRTAIGDEAATWALANTFTGAATAGNFSQILNRIEDVRRLAGRTVTVSFWANSSGGISLGVRLSQNFGTGGSPSTTVNINGTAVATTPTWTRYSVPFTLAALTGKTLGSNGDHFTQLGLAYSSGTTNATLLGVGAQSGSINIWGVQIEFGANATLLEKSPYAAELLACQRYYEVCNAWWMGDATIGGTYGVMVAFAVEKRNAPTMTSLNQAGAANGLMNARATGTSLQTPTRGCNWVATAVSTGPDRGFSDNFSASADL